MTANYLNLGSTIRSVTAEKTVARLKPHLSDFGITRVANVTGLDTIGIPVYICIRPNAKHLSVSQGKGASDALAQASAIMEAIEVYHIENPKLPHKIANYRDLKKQEATHVANPEIFNPGFFVAPNWQEYTINWALGKDLNAEQPILLPHFLTCLNSTYKAPEKNFLAVGSNGLASGNTLEEATCHALYEVIERHDSVLFNSTDMVMQEKQRIDLATLEDPFLKELLRQIAAAGILVVLSDMTSNIGVPTFQCSIYDTNLLRKIGSFHGSGTHLVKEIAAARAITEAAQSRLTYISGARDDIFPQLYLNRQGEQNYIPELLRKDGEKKFNDVIEPKYKKEFVSNIKTILELLKKAGYKEAFLFDHTRKPWQIPVVQVFVPHLKCRLSH